MDRLYFPNAKVKKWGSKLTDLIKNDYLDNLEAEKQFIEILRRLDKIAPYWSDKIEMGNLEPEIVTIDKKEITLDMADFQTCVVGEANKFKFYDDQSNNYCGSCIHYAYEFEFNLYSEENFKETVEEFVDHWERFHRKDGKLRSKVLPSTRNDNFED